MPRVSVTIISLNEAEHIGAAIDSVAWADEVIVVDEASAAGLPSAWRVRAHLEGWVVLSTG